MRMRPVIAAMAALLVWGVVSPAPAQKKPPKPPPPPKNWNGKPPPKYQVKELREFQKMSPEQREKELAKLPPQQCARVEQQMARLDNMNPEQRERMLNKLETMQHLTP